MAWIDCTDLAKSCRGNKSRSAVSKRYQLIHLFHSGTPEWHRNAKAAPGAIPERPVMTRCKPKPSKTDAVRAPYRTPRLCTPPASDAAVPSTCGSHQVCRAQL